MSHATTYRAFYGEPYLRKIQQEGYPPTDADRKKFNLNFYQTELGNGRGKHETNAASTAISRLNNCIKAGQPPAWVKNEPTLVAIFADVVEDYKSKYGDGQTSDTTQQTDVYDISQQTDLDQSKPDNNEEVNNSLNELTADKTDETKKRQPKRKPQDSENEAKPNKTVKIIKSECIENESADDVSVPQSLKTVSSLRSKNILQQLKEEIAMKDAKIAELEKELHSPELSEKQMKELEEMFAFTKERIRQILSHGK